MRCLYCKTTTVNPFKLGNFMKSGKVTAHYFCILLSENLPQKGQDSDGILGFLPKDILQLYEDRKKTICVYCHKGGATLKCVKCPRFYHLPCLHENKGCPLFAPVFTSVCNDHYEIDVPDDVTVYNWTCVICLEPIKRRDFVNFQNRALLPPCCKKNMVHELCAQELAVNAAFFTKCPMCQDLYEFKTFLNMNGVFIEHRDSHWHDHRYVPDAEMNRLTECVAEKCITLKGRRHISNTGQFQIIPCTYCGSEGVHAVCNSFSKTYACKVCVNVTKNFIEGVCNNEAGPSGLQQTSVISNSPTSQPQPSIRRRLTKNGGRTLNIPTRHSITNSLRAYTKHCLRSGTRYSSVNVYGIHKDSKTNRNNNSSCSKLFSSRKQNIRRKFGQGQRRKCINFRRRINNRTEQKSTSNIQNKNEQMQ